MTLFDESILQKPLGRCPKAISEHPTSYFARCFVVLFRTLHRTLYDATSNSFELFVVLCKHNHRRKYVSTSKSFFQKALKGCYATRNFYKFPKLIALSHRHIIFFKCSLIFVNHRGAMVQKNTVSASGQMLKMKT